MDFGKPVTASSEPSNESSKTSSTEILVSFVFRHELTDGAAERNFPSELFQKVQQIKNGRKETVLALDPLNISVADIKAFLLEEYGLKSISVETNKETCSAQMIMLSDAKVILDSVTISDLLVAGDLKMVPSPKGDKYILSIIFLPANPQLSSPVQQQKAIDTLLKNLSTPPSPCSFNTPLEPKTHQTTVSSSPTTPQNEMDTVAPDLTSANGTQEGNKQGKGRKKRKRINIEQSDSAEIPMRGWVGEPNAKRLRMLVPNIKLAVIQNSQNVSVGGGGAPQVFGNFGGAETVGGSRSVMFPLSASPAPCAVPYPLMPLPGNRAIQTPQIPVSPNRRWAFSALEMNAITHLAVGHKKVTVIFEDDDGSIQTVSVMNRA